VTTGTTGTAAEFLRLTGAGDRPGPRQIALVPGEEVPVLTLDLPAGLRGQAREEVARRQIRDRIGLAEGAVEMRPFHPGTPAEGWTRALVADAARVAEWRGTDCRAVLPDYLSLPAAEGLWTLSARPDPEGVPVVMARLGPGDGFTAPAPLARAMLERALAGAETPPRAVLRLGAELPEIETVLTARGVPVVTDPAALEPRGLPAPAVLGHGELDYDLRRDPQAARARLRRRVLPWRWPLLAGLAAAALWSAAEITAIRRIEADTAAIRAETLAMVRRSFLPEGPILDIRTQVARALAAQRSAGTEGEAQAAPLELFGRAAEVIAAEGALPERVAYSPAEGLVMVLRLADFAAADRLAAALRGAGLSVEVADSRVGGASEGVRSELRIAAAEAGQ